MSSLTYTSGADLEAKCALILRQRGYAVEKSGLTVRAQRWKLSAPKGRV